MDLGIDSIDDFNIKYKEVIAPFIDHKGKEGILLIEYLRNDGKLKGHCLDNNGSWKIASMSLDKVQLDFTMPPLGLINHKKAVVDITRKAKKQYRRGFTYSNGIINLKVMEEFIYYEQVKDQEHISKSGELVTDIYNPLYYSVEGALDLILSKDRPTVAITNRYYISSSPRLPYIYLGFGGYVIGRVNERSGRCLLFKSAEPLLEDVSNYVDLR